jgi:hypothetical protein
VSKQYADQRAKVEANRTNTVVWNSGGSGLGGGSLVLPDTQRMVEAPPGPDGQPRMMKESDFRQMRDVRAKIDRITAGKPNPDLQTLVDSGQITPADMQVMAA